MPPIVHTIGRYLTPELCAWQGELRTRAIVYHHQSTGHLLTAARIAKSSDEYASFSPAAIVWLQVRPGEFSQGEIDAALISDPLAKPFIVAGTLCEGEPRSGKLLADVTRLYWHQGAATLLAQLATSMPRAIEQQSPWVTIHAARRSDYQGLAGCCQTLGCKTIWQEERRPAIASEADLRLFRGWDAWYAWQEAFGQRSEPMAPAILLLDFPRHEDRERAREVNVTRVLATPYRLTDLQAALTACCQPARVTNVTKSLFAASPHAYRRTA